MLLDACSPLASTALILHSGFLCLTCPDSIGYHRGDSLREQTAVQSVVHTSDGIGHAQPQRVCVSNSLLEVYLHNPEINRWFDSASTLVGWRITRLTSHSIRAVQVCPQSLLKGPTKTCELVEWQELRPPFTLLRSSPCGDG